MNTPASFKHMTRAEPIRLRIERVNQLFQTLDPFPFRERDLDAAVEEYVVEWAREAKRRGPVSIIVEMPPEQARGKDAAHIAEAFRNYFEGRARAQGWKLRALLRGGRYSLMIGLAVLSFAILLGHSLPVLLPNGFLRRFIEEGLIILGSVANWRGLEVFLFDWWPIAQERGLYGRLAQASVEIATVQGSRP